MVVMVFILIFSFGIRNVYSDKEIYIYQRKMCEDNPKVQYQVVTTDKFYYVILKDDLHTSDIVTVKLDSLGTVKNVNESISRTLSENDLINNVFNFVILRDTRYYKLSVHGKFGPAQPPYVISIKINDEEICRNPKIPLFPNERITNIEAPWPSAPDKFCGRQKLYSKETELIVSGSASKCGDWPWHVAVYSQNPNLSKYICGGTLLSSYVVLTAAHCVTYRGSPVNPASLSVILGKCKLMGFEATNQFKDVFQIIIYDDFDHRKLNNDIALLKLSSEASFNNYVQPACLWLDDAYNQLDSYEITGTVTGWGIDQSETLTSELHEATIPIVPDSTCIRYNPVFYGNVLNGKRFCAGLLNGTSACNGDSGGGFMVFVPDVKTPTFSYPLKDRPGAWYVKGIVSSTLAKEGSRVCDNEAYTVFTDISKYRDWIVNHL